MCAGKPKTPPPPPPPPPPTKPPTRVSQDVRAARNDERRRANAAKGQRGTRKTGPSVNDSSANTAGKTLLG